MIRLTIWTLFTANLLIFGALLVPGWINPHEIPDAFATFDALTPGQPVSALHDYSCHYIYAYDYWTSGQSYCQISIPDGLIRSVTVIFKGDTISTIWFHTRDMHMVDVVNRWGRPDDLYVSKLFYIARWENGVYATAVTSGWFTLNAKVSFVSISQLPEMTTTEERSITASAFSAPST